LYLILPTLNAMAEAELEPAQFVPLAQIQLRKLAQPRRYFNPEALENLTASIRQHGILQPLLVRPLSGVTVKYELVAGERRFRAAQAAGLLTVPVVVRHLSDNEAATLALVENLQREDLNAIEETEGILALLAMHLHLTPEATTSLLNRMAKEVKRQTAPVLSQAEIEITTVFESLGRMSWESFVTSRLPLLNLPHDLQQAIQTQALDYTKAIALSRLKDDKQRSILLQQVLVSDWSVRRIQSHIKKLRHSEPPTPSCGLSPTTDDKFPAQEPLYKHLNLLNQIESFSRNLVDLLRIHRKPIFDAKKQSRLEALIVELNQILTEEC